MSEEEVKKRFQEVDQLMRNLSGLHEEISSSLRPEVQRLEEFRQMIQKETELTLQQEKELTRVEKQVEEWGRKQDELKEQMRECLLEIYRMGSSLHQSHQVALENREMIHRFLESRKTNP